MAGTDGGVERKDEEGITLADEDGNKENQSVQGPWQGLGQGQQDGAKMAGSMTADQFHAKLDPLRHRLEQLRHRMDAGATREGEDTPELDQVNKGNNGATREGEDNPKQDHAERGNTKA